MISFKMMAERGDERVNLGYWQQHARYQRSAVGTYQGRRRAAIRLALVSLQRVMMLLKISAAPEHPRQPRDSTAAAIQQIFAAPRKRDDDD